MKSKFKLGCDPEVFMRDLQGRFRSSVGLIGGSKAHPLPLPIGDGYCVQEDNVALEFNIPPAAGAKEYVESIQKTLSFLSENIRSSYGFELANISAVSFPEEELQTAAAQTFGCDPDYNAWTGKTNPSPKPPHPLMRSAGGHVHIETKKNPCTVTQMCDLMPAVPAVFMDNGVERKQLYGKAGAHRTKPYGVEYRTLSNFWIFEDELIRWVWRNTERALTEKIDVKKEEQNILEAINNNNKDVAQYLVEKYKLEVL